MGSVDACLSIAQDFNTLYLGCSLAFKEEIGVSLFSCSVHGDLRQLPTPGRCETRTCLSFWAVFLFLPLSVLR